jgi:spermidine dehydrogenase
MTLESYRMPPRRDDWEQWLDSMTYLDFLTKVLGVSPEYAKLVDPFGATVGHGLGSDVTSAYAAFEFALPGPAGYFRYITDNTDPTDLLHLAAFPGGNAGIARYFLKHLIPGSIKGDLSMSAILFNPINWQELDRAGNPARFRGGCTVVAVENIGSEKNGRVNVTYYKNGSLHKLAAKSVVMAANQAVNKKVVKGLTPELYDAMDSFMHGPVLTVNVAVRNWKFMEKLGITAARWFEGFGWFTCIRRQLMIDRREPMPLDPNKPTVLTMYVPFLYPGMPVKEQAVAARYSLLGPGFRNFELQIREQLQTLFGSSGFDAKRDIAGIVLNRWGHAYVVQPPGFYFGKDGKPAAKDVIRNTIHGRIAFAHSELTGTQVWQTAAAEGKRVVENLL